MGEATWSRLRWPTAFGGSFRSKLFKPVGFGDTDSPGLESYCRVMLQRGRDHLVNVARETHANLTRRRSVGWSRLNSCPASRFAAHRGEREREKTKQTCVQHLFCNMLAADYSRMTDFAHPVNKPSMCFHPPTVLKCFHTGES